MVYHHLSKIWTPFKDRPYTLMSNFYITVHWQLNNHPCGVSSLCGHKWSGTQRFSFSFFSLLHLSLRQYKFEGFHRWQEKKQSVKRWQFPISQRYRFRSQNLYSVPRSSLFARWAMQYPVYWHFHWVIFIQRSRPFWHWLIRRFWEGTE